MNTENNTHFVPYARELRIGIVAIILLGALVLFGAAGPEGHAQDAEVVAGYAWSDNIGWISFNCLNTASCGASNGFYGVSLDKGNGNLSGYAWSDNIGWISFNENDLAGCPSGACKAELAGNNINGWARALAGGSSGAGGWDGWISLNGSNYGVTLNGSDFNGFAWGSEVIGWVDWNPAFGGVILGEPEAPVCEAGYFCKGTDRYLRAADCSEGYVETCTDGCLNGECAEAAPRCSDGIDNDGDGKTDYPADPGCSSADDTTEQSPASNLSISATPGTVQYESTATITWSAANASNCTVSGTNGDSWSGTSGTQVTSPITSTTIYTLSCEDLEENTVTEQVVVRIQPRFEEF